MTAPGVCALLTMHLSYLVLTSGFFFAPQRGEEQDLFRSISRNVVDMFSPLM